jgi:ABC-type polysaccharide/polyol phosphate export permease
MMKKLLREILAITEKELKLHLRFKFGFFISSFVHPVLAIVPIIIIYYGFLHYSGAESFAEITLSNYINFLLLGALAHSFFSYGTNSFTSKFLNEKFWKTIETLFMSPISRFSIIFVFVLAEFIRLLPTLFIFSLISAVFILPSFINFVIILVALILVFVICLSVGLIAGSLSLGNENFIQPFAYFFSAWNLASCFIYPIGIIPEIFRPIILVNPVYQGLTIMRNLWIYGTFDVVAFIYILGFAVIMPMVAVIIYRFSWKRLGIQGY